MTDYMLLECGHHAESRLAVVHKVLGDHSEVFCDICNKFVLMRKLIKPKARKNSVWTGERPLF